MVQVLNKMDAMEKWEKQVYVHACVCVCMSVCMCVYIHVFMYMWTCVCICMGSQEVHEKHRFFTLDL